MTTASPPHFPKVLTGSLHALSLNGGSPALVPIHSLLVSPALLPSGHPTSFWKLFLALALPDTFILTNPSRFPPQE